MTTDTPRTDAMASNQPMLSAQSDPVELYHKLISVTVNYGKALDACAEYRDQLTASKAEVERLKATLESIEEYGTKEINEAVKLRQELASSMTEVERLKAKLCRTIEIADEFWKNQKQAVLVYHQELADELDQIKKRICGD